MAQSTENEGVIWHFKPLHAPHFGGVHETIIKEAERAANVMFSSPQFWSRIVVTRTRTKTTFSNKPYILLLSLIFLTFERLSRTHQILFTNRYLTKFLCKFWKLKINLSNHCPLRHSSHTLAWATSLRSPLVHLIHYFFFCLILSLRSAYSVGKQLILPIARSPTSPICWHVSFMHQNEKVPSTLA